LLGSSGAITRHSNSVSSYRRMIKLLQFGSLNHIAALEGIPFMSSWPKIPRRVESAPAMPGTVCVLGAA
ncbi:MAG TPA: hypothetical protein VFA50_20320, partial [Stellaceae bacterium]|nr:hypothetical protein [Stellaceae bacterium]